MLRRLLVVPIVLASCATTPEPGSKEEKLSEQIELLEGRIQGLQAELAAQRPKIAAAFQAATRAEESAIGKAQSCSLVRGATAPEITAATPARFDLAKKKFRLTATFPAGRPAGANTLSNGTCAVVSP